MHEKLEKLDSEATANQGKVAPLRAKLDTVKKQVSDKYGAVKKLREEWKKENDVFFEHMKEVKRIRAQIRKIEDEDYRKHQAEQQKLREEEEAKTKPWLAEIALCDSLSTYLRGLLPKSSDGSEGAGAAESKSADNTVTMADGTVVQVVRKRDNVDQGGMQFGKSSKSKKKGRKKNRKQKVKTQIRHDMVTLSSFAHLASESGQKLPRQLRLPISRSP